MKKRGRGCWTTTAAEFEWLTNERTIRVDGGFLTRPSEIFSQLRREDAERVVDLLLETGQVQGPVDSPHAVATLAALVDGSLILVRESVLPRTLDAPEITPLMDLAEPPMESATELAFISIALEHEDGGPVVEERYVIVPVSGPELRGDLDGAGEALHEGLAKGTCAVSFPDRDKGDWIELGEVPFVGRGLLDTMLVSEDEHPAVDGLYDFSDEGTSVDSGPLQPGGRAFADVPAGDPETFKLTARELRWWTPQPTRKPVEPRPVDGTFVCEFEDLLFNLNSPVMLPTHREDPNAPQAEDRITGLSVLAAVLRFAEVNARTLLIVGHTDTSGTREYNLTLSGERAGAVHSLLRRDRSAWADTVTDKHFKADWKTILKWVHDTFGWDCDPGPATEKTTAISSSARDAFRARYHETFGIEIDSGEHNRGDWEAYFDLYQLGLAKLMGLSPEALEATLDALAFTEPATLACGEVWPREKPGKDAFVSAANRRVELWLFETGEVPDLVDPQPAGAALYGPGTKLEPRYLTLGATDGGLGYELLVVDAQQKPLVGVAVHLSQGGVEFQVDVTDSIGRVLVEAPAEGEVTLTVDGHIIAAGPGTVEDAEELFADGVVMPPQPGLESGRTC